jgi:hypothetical protein
MVGESMRRWRTRQGGLERVESEQEWRGWPAWRRFYSAPVEVRRKMEEGKRGSMWERNGARPEV